MIKPEKIHHIHRIVIFTLDSLYSGVGIYRYIEEFPERVALICVSERYGRKYGSFFRQLKKNFVRSGFAFIHYLSYHFVYFYLATYFFGFFNKLLGRNIRTYSIWQLAKKHKIPIITTNEPNDPAIVEKIKNFNPDLIITTYFDHIIKKDLIDLPKFGIINVHTALLPDYKGPFPALWPMIKNEKEVGITVHYINNEFLDAGPILAQKKVKVLENESVLGLDCRLVREGVELAIRVVYKIEDGTSKSVSQELYDRNKYYSYPTRMDLKGRNFRLSKFSDFFKQFV